MTVSETTYLKKVTNQEHFGVMHSTFVILSLTSLAPHNDITLDTHIVTNGLDLFKAFFLRFREVDDSLEQ